MVKHIQLPLNEQDVAGLRAGDNVLLTGVMYSARDAAHKKITDSLKLGQKLPFELNNQTIYYMGPAPAKPGYVIGSCGPTTSSRMDVYTPALLAAGLKGMIGKGQRTLPVLEAIKRYKAVYFGAIGGSGALISKAVLKSEVVAYGELRAEAVRRIEVKDFPVTVINDIYGADLYQQGKAKYKTD